MPKRWNTARSAPRTERPMATVGANIILGLAMLAAILIGTSDISIRSITSDLGATEDVQGTLVPHTPD